MLKCCFFISLQNGEFSFRNLIGPYRPRGIINLSEFPLNQRPQAAAIQAMISTFLNACKSDGKMINNQVSDYKLLILTAQSHQSPPTRNITNAYCICIYIISVSLNVVCINLLIVVLPLRSYITNACKSFGFSLNYIN